MKIQLKPGKICKAKHILPFRSVKVSHNIYTLTLCPSFKRQINQISFFLFMNVSINVVIPGSH